MAQRTKKGNRGFGFIEVLVSSLILAISILAALSLYGFSMGMIDKTGDESTAYTLARQTIEHARTAGFSNAVLPDGTVTEYWDSNGLNKTNSPVKGTTRFKLVRKVSSDKLSGSAPAPDAIRTVTVVVYFNVTGEKLEQTGTLIVRAGV